MSPVRPTVPALAVLAALLGCPAEPPPAPPAALTGAWRASIQFSSGAFSGIKDLEFLYVFNAGGTLTESSNYDGAPPVPPRMASGVRSAPMNSRRATSST